MNQRKQILLAFFIPLFSAIGLAFAAYFIFLPDQCVKTTGNQAEQVCFYISEAPLPLGQQEYGFLVFGLFILALILPSFVMMRTYQNRRNKLGSTLNIE